MCLVIISLDSRQPIQNMRRQGHLLIIETPFQKKPFGVTGFSMVLWSWSIVWWMVWLPRQGRLGRRCKGNGVAIYFQDRWVPDSSEPSFCKLILLLGWRTRTFENGPPSTITKEDHTSRTAEVKTPWNLSLASQIVLSSFSSFTDMIASKRRVSILKSR